MKSPVKWLTDDAFSSLPGWERSLVQASAWVGEREEGRNSGPFVTRILGWLGLRSGLPWCAAFVSAAMRKSGFEFGPKSGRAAVRNWAKWAVASKRAVKFDGVQRGDLFYWLNEDKSGHIGFVARVLPNGQFQTIEGNTNDAGSREGDGVYRRVRNASRKMRFIKTR